MTVRTSSHFPLSFDVLIITSRIMLMYRFNKNQAIRTFCPVFNFESGFSRAVFVRLR